MKNDRKTKNELIEELKSVRRKVKKLETLLKKRKQTKKDITERKKAEEKITYQAQLLSIVNDAIVASDAQYKLTAWNAAAESMYGWKVEEVLGRFGLDITCTEFPGVDKSEVLRAIVERGSWRGEATQARKDGTRFSVEVSSVVLRDATGKVTGFVSVNRDITERKLAEQASKQAEESLAILAHAIRSIGECVSITDAENKILFVNDAFLGTYGYAADELIGKPIAVVRSPTTEPVADEILSATLQGGWQGELVNRKKDGTEFPISLSTSVVRNEKRQVLGLVGIATDITERKREEEALRQSEENFKALAENANDGILIGTGEEGWHVYANRRAVEITGYPIEELLKTRIRDLAHPDELLKLTERHKKRLAGVEVPKPYETAIVNKDGIKVPIEISPSRTIWQNQLANIVILRDITERKRAEEILHFTRFALDNAVEAMVCLSQNARYIDANDTFCRSVGYSREELLSMTAHDIDPNFSAKIWPEFWEKLKQSGSLTFESCHRTKDGKVFPVEVTVTFFEYKGKEYHCGFARDITERKLAESQREAELQVSKRVEEELRKSHEELRMLANHLQTVREEERNHLAREFHDQLGQLMTALKMDLALLLRMISDEKQDISRKYIAEELKSAQKIVDETTQLVWEIIVELRPQMLDDLGLLAALEWETERFQSRTGITCEFKSSAGDIQIDSKKSIALFRIYQEALTNIARHANATVVTSVLRRDDETLVLEIKDNGCGISIDEQLKQKSLGLIGMRERALAIGGSFEISGAAGEGTTIIVRLPL